MERRLHRSRRDNIIAGVAGGLAEYFEIDATLIRLVWLLLVLAGGSGLFLYLVAWVIIPAEPGTGGTRPFQSAEAMRDAVVAQAKSAEEWLKARIGSHRHAAPPDGRPEGEQPVGELPAAPDPPSGQRGGPSGRPDGSGLSPEKEAAGRQRLGGLLLIAVGAILIFRNYFSWVDVGQWWPVLLVGVGLLMIVRGLGERRG